jgi:sporulation protein YlmC with PRC-barrel domain
MNLVCDLLDQPVVDRRGQPMGRVDGLVLDLRDGAPPRVRSIAIGPTVLGERLHPVIGRWVEAIEHRLGISRGRPIEIAMERVSVERRHVRADVGMGETAAVAVEQLCRRWIARLPGSR